MPKISHPFFLCVLRDFLLVWLCAFGPTASAGLFYQSDEEIKKAIEESKRISIVYATENLKSPISSFGHIFLVFHRERVPLPQSIAVEFVGNLAVDFAIFRSLFWSIPGEFRAQSFYQKRRDYERENRNLWFAEIKLNEDQKNSLIRSTLSSLEEIKPYNFFLFNCAGYIHDLANKPFIKGCKVPFVETPLSSYQRLRSCGLLKKAGFLPSKQRQFASLYRALTSPQKKQVKVKVESFQSDAVESGLAGLDLASKRTVSKWIDYRLPKLPHEHERDKYFRAKTKLSNSAHDHKVSLEGDGSLKGDSFFRHQKFSLSYDFYNNHSELSLAPAFIFFENTEASGDFSDELLIGSFAIKQKSGDFYIRRFDLFRLRSHRPEFIYSPGFTRSLELFYEEFGSREKFLRQSELSLAGGWSFLLEESSYLTISSLFGVSGGLYEWSSEDEVEDLAGFLELGLFYRLTDSFRGRLLFKHYLSTNQAKKREVSFKGSLIDFTTKNLSVSYSKIFDRKSLGQSLDSIRVHLSFFF